MYLFISLWQDEDVDCVAVPPIGGNDSARVPLDAEAVQAILGGEIKGQATAILLRS